MRYMALRLSPNKVTYYKLIFSVAVMVRRLQSIARTNIPSLSNKNKSRTINIIN